MFCVSIVSFPPSGIASRALIARLMMAFSSWFGSASTGHSRGASTASTSIVSPSVRCSNSDMPGIRRLMSTGFGRKRLPARERKQALRKRCCAVGASEGAIGVSLQMLRILGKLLPQQIEVAAYDLQKIVEVVRNAAGELADSLHLLGLPQGLVRGFKVARTFLHALLEGLIGALCRFEQTGLSMAIAA